MIFTGADVDRIEARVEFDDSGCWNWTGHIDNKGYGIIRYRQQNRRVGAHRYVYMALVGEIPAGLQLDHLCKNTRCVNPDHLEPVTGRVNTQRARAKDFCKNGHAFIPENRYYSGNKSTCRLCNIEWQHRKREVA